MQSVSRRVGMSLAPAAARNAASTNSAMSRLPQAVPLPQAVMDLCDLTSGLWALDGDFVEVEKAEAAVPRGRALEEALKQVTWTDGSAVLKLLGAVEAESAPLPPTSQVPAPPQLSNWSVGGAGSVVDKSEILDLSTGGGADRTFEFALRSGEKCVRDDSPDKVNALGNQSWADCGTRDSLPTVAATTKDSLPWTAMTENSLPWGAMTRDNLPSAAAVFTHDTLPMDPSGFSVASYSKPGMPKDASNISLMSSMNLTGLPGGMSSSGFPMASATFGAIAHM